MHMEQLFVELWSNLQEEGDSNVDGVLTLEEWVRDAVLLQHYFAAEPIFNVFLVPFVGRTLG